MGKKKFRQKSAAPSAAAQQIPTPIKRPRGVIEQYASVLAFLICLISFFVHLYGADFDHRKGMTSVDESVYSRLGFQLKAGEPYNTIQMYQENLRAGQKLPDYFKDPLFKHPPFFPFLISLSYVTLPQKNNYSFTELYAKSSLVPNMMGCLLIFVTFLMGRRLYDYRVGLLAALFIALEVNLLNCSMKVWMDSTLAAMFWLSVFLFHKGIDKHWMFILAGIAAGCALLTKYPAVLLFVIIISYLIIFERRVLKSYHFYLGLLMTGVVMIPWLSLNVETYGADTLTSAQFRGWDIRAFMKFIVLTVTVAFLFLVSRFMKWKWPERYQKFKTQAPKVRLFWSGVLFMFVAFLLTRGDFRGSLMQALNWSGTLDRTGWDIAKFNNQEPYYFYLRHILEYSPLYIFFLIGLVKAPLGSKSDKFLLLASFWTLLFAAFYGSYQGRYILYFTPAGVMLAAAVITEIFDRLLHSRTPMRIGFTVLFCGFLIFFAAKTARISLEYAINNNIAYY